jgi:hypothetical protein
VIEVCLAHKESDRVRRAYNRAQVADERRALLEAWATVANLQIALDRAHGRIRDLEAIAANANQRTSEAVELADTMQMMMLAMQDAAGAMRPNRDVSHPILTPRRIAPGPFYADGFIALIEKTQSRRRSP